MEDKSQYEDTGQTQEESIVQDGGGTHLNPVKLSKGNDTQDGEYEQNSPYVQNGGYVQDNPYVNSYQQNPYNPYAQGSSNQQYASTEQNGSYTQDGSNQQYASTEQNGSYAQDSSYQQYASTGQNGPYVQGNPYAQNGSTGQNGPYTQGRSYGQNGSMNQNGPYAQNSAYTQNGPYGPQNQYQQYQKADDRTYTTGFGIASMILGILSLMLFCTCVNIPLAVAAVIFGILQYMKGPQGRGMAIAGIVTAVLSVIALIVMVALMWGPFMRYYQEAETYYEQARPGYEYEYDYDDGFDNFFDFFDNSDKFYRDKFY